MTKSFVTIFLIIVMSLAVTLIRAHPAHSFAIWMVTCTQEEETDEAPDFSDPAILTNVDPDPGRLTCNTVDPGGDPHLPAISTCAECLNALVGSGSKSGVDSGLLEGIKVTYTTLEDGGSLIQALVVAPTIVE